MNGVNYLEKLIEAKNLTKNFEKIKAVNNINIDLNNIKTFIFIHQLLAYHLGYNTVQ